MAYSCSDGSWEEFNKGTIYKVRARETNRNATEFQGWQRWTAITTARTAGAERGAMTKTGEGSFVKSTAWWDLRPLVETKLRYPMSLSSFLWSHLLNPKRKLESREVKGPVQRGQSSGYRAGQRRFGEAKENTQHTKNIHKGRVSF